MKLKYWMSTAVAAMAFASAGVTHAVVLPPEGSPSCVLFGDFTSCSLPVAGISVPSTPGAIQDGIVVMTGASGVPVNTNVAGIDNAYPTPGGSGPFFFDTALIADPSNGPIVDSPNHWDADVAAVRNELAGGELVVFFNLNETAGDGLAGQDLLAWVHVALIDTAGILPTLDYFLSAADNQLGVFTPEDERAEGLAQSIANGAPDPDPASDPAGTGVGSLADLDPRWAYAAGRVCAFNGAIIRLGACTGDDPGGATTVNQNLGANEAAFAIFNSDLSARVNDVNSGYDLISTRILLSRIDNGFEQAFILPGTIIPRDVVPVPEPASLGLIGAGFIALALVRRRRRGMHTG